MSERVLRETLAQTQRPGLTSTSPKGRAGVW